MRTGDKTDQTLTTKRIAKMVGVHPNTVRLYEDWGYLPPIPRASNNYRIYSNIHLEQMRLARIALPGPYPGGGKPVYELVKQAAQGNYDVALQLAIQYSENVRREHVAAEEALSMLESWGQCDVVESRVVQFSRSQAARLLNTTAETLRNWERNGLIDIPRDQHGNRIYENKELARLKIIRVLREAGYGLMAILRMFHHLDSGNRDNLREILDTPHPQDDIRYATDQWLTTLKEHEERALKIIKHLKDRVQDS